MNPFAAFIPRKERPANVRSLVMMPEGGIQINGYSKDDLLEILAALKGQADGFTQTFPDREKPSGGYA